MAKSLMGKFEDRIDTGDRPPKIEESLCLVIAERLARKGLPHEMPQVPIEVAGWWMTMQEAPGPFDNPHRVPLMGGDGYRWECPYHRRLEYTLRKFMDMKPDERRMIVAAREDRVYWRGDDIWFFMHVIGETTRMRGMGVATYREESLKRMKHGIRHLTQDPGAAAERTAIQNESSG